MSKRFIWGYLFLFVFVFVGKTLADNATQNSTSSSSSSTSTTSTTTKPATTTTPKPKVDIFASDICKKICSCKTLGDSYELNCTGNLPRWFSDSEWATLQNGDKTFDTIIFEHNNFTSIPVFPAYPVKSLYLGFNQINKIAPLAFQNLTMLIRLDLSHNKLTGQALQPDIFKGLYSPDEDNPLGKLTDLNLGHNEIHTLNKDIFQHIPDVQNLTLCQNVMRSIDVSTEMALNSLQNLKMLDLSFMELRKIPASIFNTNRNLETLILASNLLETLPEHLDYAQGLHSLNIDDNPIAKFSGANIFPKLDKLKSLSISFMSDLVEFDSGTFKNLENLEILVASDNQKLSTIHSDAFSRKALNVTEVYLNNNNLTVFDHLWFPRWDQIQILDLRFNPWTCNCSNDFLLQMIVPQINSTKPIFLQNVACATPSQYKDVPLLTLSANRSDLPCEPSAKNVLVACLIVLILVVLPLSIGSVIMYRRGCFGLRNRFNRRNERSLYSRATFTDDFHI